MVSSDFTFPYWRYRRRVRMSACRLNKRMSSIRTPAWAIVCKAPLRMAWSARSGRTALSDSVSRRAYCCLCSLLSACHINFFAFIAMTRCKDAASSADSNVFTVYGPLVATVFPLRKNTCVAQFPSSRFRRVISLFSIWRVSPTRAAVAQASFMTAANSSGSVRTACCTCALEAAGRFSVHHRWARTPPRVRAPCRRAGSLLEFEALQNRAHRRWEVPRMQGRRAHRAPVPTVGGQVLPLPPECTNRPERLPSSSPARTAAEPLQTRSVSPSLSYDSATSAPAPSAARVSSVSLSPLSECRHGRDCVFCAPVIQRALNEHREQCRGA